MTIPRRRGETVEEAQAALGVALDWLSTLQYLQREEGLRRWLKRTDCSPFLSICKKSSERINERATRPGG